MARGLSFIPLLVSLAVGAWFLSGQLGQTPSPGTVTQALGQVREAAAGLTFVQAVTQLEQFHATSGTYVGAPLAGLKVKLVRANAGSYCMQATVSGNAYHVAGPGGTALSGPC
jgi:hypothetical protein